MCNHNWNVYNFWTGIYNDTRTYRRKKNVVEIGKKKYRFSLIYLIYFYILGYNLGSWVLEVVGAVSSLIVVRYNFLFALVISVGISTGLTPVIYLLGASNFKSKLRIFPKNNSWKLTLQFMVVIFTSREWKSKQLSP